MANRYTLRPMRLHANTEAFANRWRTPCCCKTVSFRKGGAIFLYGIGHARSPRILGEGVEADILLYGVSPEFIMVICCAASNCTNRQGKGSRGRVSFHRFPLKDPARLAIWASALHRDNWSPGPYSFLCSNHFSPDSFLLRMPDQIPLLKPTAVPSIFPNSQANRKTEHTRLYGGGTKVGKKKLLPKRPLPSIQDHTSLSLGEDLHTEKTNQCNIVVNDLEDRSSVLIHGVSSNIPSARKFISSLHSYSRSSLPSVSQNVKPMGHVEDSRSTGHACNDRTLYTEVSDMFPPDTSQSVDYIQIDSETSSQSQCVVPSSFRKAMSPSASVEQPYLSTTLKSGFNSSQSDQFTSHTITSLHTYCSPSKSQSGNQNQLKKKRTDREQYFDPDVLGTQNAPPLNPAVTPLAWMLGTWESEPAGKGEFPTISSFQYKEVVDISHVGQPMFNFTFCASNPDTGKPLHRECGFIRINPGTNQVAFICAQNMGIVEIEEGEVQGEQLTLTSRSLSRTSFAKEPFVQQICRIFRLTPEGKLEQTVSMATSTQPLAPHLHITYRKASS